MDAADAVGAGLHLMRCRPALGTFVEIRIGGPGSADRALPAEQAVAAAADIDAAFAAIEQVEALMSFHRPASDLARLNRATPGERLRLHPWTVDVLALAADLHCATGGLFDCAIGGELIDAGLLPGERPGAGSGSIADIEFLGADGVRLRRPVCIDLGGIAKGAAVDRAIEVLKARGVDQASVNAGGDLRVCGPEPEPVRLRSPVDPVQVIDIGSLVDGAIATSSVCHSGDCHGGRWRSALIDPRSRRPVADRRSFSVLAGRCAVADGLTKALAVAGGLPRACLDRYGATALVV